MNVKQVLGAVLNGLADYLVGYVFIGVASMVFGIIIAIVSAVASVVSWIANMGWILGWWFQACTYTTALTMLLALSRTNPVWLLVLMVVSLFYGFALILLLWVFRHWFLLRGKYLYLKTVVGLLLGVGLGYLAVSVDWLNLVILASGYWVFWMTPLDILYVLLLFYGIAEGVSLIYGLWR